MDYYAIELESCIGNYIDVYYSYFYQESQRIVLLPLTISLGVALNPKLFQFFLFLYFKRVIKLFYFKHTKMLTSLPLCSFSSTAAFQLQYISPCISFFASLQL